MRSAASRSSSVFLISIYKSGNAGKKKREERVDDVVGMELLFISERDQKSVKDFYPVFFGQPRPVGSFVGEPLHPMTEFVGDDLKENGVIEMVEFVFESTVDFFWFDRQSRRHYVDIRPGHSGRLDGVRAFEPFFAVSHNLVEEGVRSLAESRFELSHSVFERGRAERNFAYYEILGERVGNQPRLEPIRAGVFRSVIGGGET